jgi:hypothetical protein
MNIENRLFEQYFIEFIWTLVINPFVLMIFFLLLLDVNCLKLIFYVNQLFFVKSQDFF